MADPLGPLASRSSRPRRDGLPQGCTVNTFTSVSLNPVLLLVCLKQDSTTLAAVRESGRFAVNILATGQHELAWRFAGVELEPRQGVPVLSDCLGWIAAEVENELRFGDHAIVLARPVDGRADEEREPLLFFRSRLG